MAWNPNDKGTGIVLSAGDTIASMSGGTWKTVRSVISHSDGKRYFEIELTSTAAFDNVMVGFAQSSHALTAYLGNSSPVSFGLWSKDGSFYQAGVTNIVGQAASDYNVGDIVGVSLDLDEGLMSLSVNGVEVITGAIPLGSYFPAVSLQNTASATLAVNGPELLYKPTDHYAWGALASTLPTNLDSTRRQEIIVLNEDRTLEGLVTIASGTSDLVYLLPPSEDGLIEFYAFDTDEGRSVYKTEQINPDSAVDLEFLPIFGGVSSSSQSSEVSGIVQLEGTPAQRTVRAFGYDPTAHEIDGNTLNLSKSLGHATSDPQTGEYTIDLLAGYDKRIFVVAFDDYGADFQPALAVAVGDRVHPSTPNEYVWECVGAGTLPSEEPAWVIDTETAQLYGTASMIAKPFYRPMVHGPVIPEVVVINKNDLLAALDAAGTLDSGAYTPETWAILDDAVQAGQAVYDDPEADQATVDAATQAIDDAMSGLGAPKLVPTVIGEAFGGGYYAGDIEDGGQWYKLIVADIAANVGGLRWGGYGTNLQAATSTTNGPANTEAMRGASTYEAGNYCLDYRGGGFDDWYMPARSELQVIYENLGHNKTPPAGFESGGAQAFHASHYYWCSTQNSANNAWTRWFSDGYESYSSKTSTLRRVRPVRRIPFTPEAS